MRRAITCPRRVISPITLGLRQLADDLGRVLLQLPDRHLARRA